MAKRKKPRWLVHLEYAVVKLFLAILGMFHFRRAFGMARAIGWLVYRLDRRHRARAMENLQAAFHEKTEKECARITLAVYMHLVESVVETVAMLRLFNRRNAMDYVTADGLETLEQTARTGTGIIFVTGHIGSWEALGAISALCGYPLWSLARPLDNPLLNDLVVEMRERTGQRIIDRDGAMIQSLRVLKSGGYLAFLVDQDARRAGVFVPFMGRPASTHTSVARIAMKTGRPIFFSYAVRRGSTMRFHVRIVGPLWPRPDADEEEEVYRLTATFTRWLEEAVREFPDRWLWLHRRWKTPPPPASAPNELHPQINADTNILRPARPLPPRAAGE